MLNPTFSYLSIDESKTLRCGLDKLKGRLSDLNQNSNPEQPLFIKILERPHKFISLPFQIDLLTHDCLHVLLGLGTYMHDEAFLLGFTMGNSQRIHACHKAIYKFLSHNFYPKSYGLTDRELMIFDRGYQYGKSITQASLDTTNFEPWLDTEISILRDQFQLHHYGTKLDDYLQDIQVEQTSFRIADALA
jgi:hypothetical protein